MLLGERQRVIQQKKRAWPGIHTEHKVNQQAVCVSEGAHCPAKATGAQGSLATCSPKHMGNAQRSLRHKAGDSVLQGAIIATASCS
jgi:hypothetical protein